MKLVLVTGLSGAGKTQALRVLEDIGFYCVDNLPPIMLQSLVGLCTKQNAITETAVVVDARGGIFFKGITEMMDAFDRDGVEYEILFLEASDDTLMRRYKETRRAHPLERSMTIDMAIKNERELLAPMRERAARIIDTSNMKTRELRETIMSMYRPEKQESTVPLSVMSFGYKNGVPPEADWVFDARFIPNPFYIPEMRALSGMDAAVYDYVMSFPETQQFLDKVIDIVSFLLPFCIREGNKYPCIAIGCTGGRHRSVAVARAVAEALTERGYNVDVQHKDLIRDTSRR